MASRERTRSEIIDLLGRAADQAQHAEAYQALVHGRLIFGQVFERTANNDAKLGCLLTDYRQPDFARRM